jgi:23S rRNA (cytosine1962-C5)-methyltransferase
MPDMARSTPARPRLRITSAAETAVRSGHPWIFSDSVQSANRPGESGELAVIYDRHDQFLAIGLYDPDSPLRVRVLHMGKPVTIDAAWWLARLQRALARRHGQFDAQTTGYRLINGESDGWPGLVLDRYADTLVLKLYTAAWFPRLNEVAALLQQHLNAEQLVLRLSRNIQAAGAAQNPKRADGDLIFSGPGPAASRSAVVFCENGLRFEADVWRGQKTGFFLDQRENRREVGMLAAGRRVLNAFSFSGGFSVYAARGGAVAVTDLDISAHALESAGRNFALNQSIAAVAACRRDTVQADAFDWLAHASAKFGLVVLDPPSLARRAGEREGAVHAYERLNALGIARLARGAILVAASCSAHVPAPDFFMAVRRAATKSGRPFRELKTALHPIDHPAGFKEAEYLKAIYLQFTD